MNGLSDVTTRSRWQCASPFAAARRLYSHRHILAKLPTLAKTRQVIAVEMHGSRAQQPTSDRPLSYEQMADDTAALLAYLKIENADFFGYSMGGSVALQVAIRHPAMVRKLVVASTTSQATAGIPRCWR